MPAREGILAPGRGSRANGVGQVASFFVDAFFFDGDCDERSPEKSTFFEKTTRLEKTGGFCSFGTTRLDTRVGT